MKKALIEPRRDYPTGFRIAQVQGMTFPVASPLSWVDCGDDVTTDYAYDGSAFALPAPRPSQPTPSDHEFKWIVGQINVIRAALPSPLPAINIDGARREIG